MVTKGNFFLLLLFFLAGALKDWSVWGPVGVEAFDMESRVKWFHIDLTWDSMSGVVFMLLSAV